MERHKIVGRRLRSRVDWEDVRRLLATAATLRPFPGLVPRGVYRFESFEEAETWLTRTIATALVRHKSKTRLGLGVLTDRAVDEVDDHDVQRYTVVRVADEIIVDLMGRACGLAYGDDVADVELLELEGVTIPLASKRTLIRTKETVRPSDLADRRFLQSLIDEEHAQAPKK